jgi:hypothetical protein
VTRIPVTWALRNSTHRNPQLLAFSGTFQPPVPLAPVDPPLRPYPAPAARPSSATYNSLLPSLSRRKSLVLVPVN